MLRTYKKMENETIEVGKLAQITGDKITTRFPLFQKGIDLKTIENTYPAGYNSLGKMDNDKVITIVSNIVYISKYQDGKFTDITSLQLTPTPSDYIRTQIVNISNNKNVIIFTNRNVLSYYILNVNEASNTYTLSDPYVISSDIKFYTFDSTCLSPNKIVVGYFQNITGDYFNVNPAFSVIDINKLTHTTLVLEDAVNAKFKPYVTKISDTEFLASYAITIRSAWGSECDVMNHVFSINSIGIIEQQNSFQHTGLYYSQLSVSLKPLYLENNKMLTCEFKDNFTLNLVIREIKKDLVTGVYTFTTKSTIESTSPHPHYYMNIDFLRNNIDGTKDYIAFNNSIVNIDTKNNKLSIKETFPQLATKRRDFNVPTVVNLGDNLLLTLDDNNFQTYSYSENEGNVIGVVQSGDADNYNVVISGLVKDIANATFETGKGVYYDELGNLSHTETGTYVGYAVSSNSLILRPEMINTPEIIKDSGSGGYIHNGNVYYHGFIPYISESIINGQTYYLDNLGNLTTTETNTKIGTGLGKGLYIKREKIVTQAEIDAQDLATIQAISNSIILGGEITGNIVIPIITEEGVTATFTSNSTYLTNAGVVTRPDNITGNQIVILTLKLDKGTQTITKQFTFTILALVSLNPVYAISTTVPSPNVAKGGTTTVTVKVTKDDVEVIEPFTTTTDNSSIAAVESTVGNKVTIRNVSPTSNYFWVYVTLDNYPNITTTRQMVAL